MTDTIKASVITDHPFMPRHGSPYLCGHERADCGRDDCIAPDCMNPTCNRFLYEVCNMAEAAHRETTVKR